MNSNYTYPKDPANKLGSLTLPWPCDWEELFGADRPLILEIGFGYGHFLEHLHRTRPDASIIGIEINNSCLVKVEKGLLRKQMHNVRVIHSTAETALHHLFRPQSISEVHINFPDPWFKDRHAGRRLMQRDTLDAIVSRLKPGGKLFLATDIIDYAEMSSELLEATSGLTNLLSERWTHEMPGRTVTKYEKKARQEGRPCHYFAYERNQLTAPDVPVIEEFPMPHMVIKTPLQLEELLTGIRQQGLNTQEFEAGETRISFKYGYLGDQSLLFDVYVHEATIDQRVGIALVARDEFPGEYTLKLSALGNPRPTEGIHKAVRLLGDALIQLHPETEVIQDKTRS